MKLTAEAAQAFTNLRGNRDFENVLKWMREYEADQTDTCTTAEGANLHRAQGSVKALRRTREAYAEAPDILTKIINNKR